LFRSALRNEKPDETVIINSDHLHNDGDMITSRNSLQPAIGVPAVLLFLLRKLFGEYHSDKSKTSTPQYVCCSLPVACRVTAKVAIGDNAVIWRRSPALDELSYNRTYLLWSSETSMSVPQTRATFGKSRGACVAARGEIGECDADLGEDKCVAGGVGIDGCSHWHSGDGGRAPRVLLLAWLLISATVTIGSIFSTSSSTSFMEALRPPASRSFAACLRRRRAGRSHSHAVIVIRANKAATPPTAMTARTEVDMPPTDAAMFG
jgi:hypothetical protein